MSSVSSHPGTLVLLPGLDGTGVLFEPLIAALPSHITPHVITYPGDEPLDYDQLHEYVMARLPASGSFAVLGESFSGPIALRIACSEPRAKAVVLCATFIRNPVRYLPKLTRHFVFATTYRAFPSFSRAKALLGGYSTPELRASLRRAHAMVKPEVFASRARAILTLDAREALMKCRAPLMYLGGTRDGVVPKHNARLIHALRPDCEMVEVRAPHLLLQTAPDEAACAIASFLSRTM
jgi:pimeloyl-[acyl-carrier protein] methyl ester esterase